MTPSPRCDIFCRVVDNYGDIGVAWRLARQLALEHHLQVRLIADNLNSLRRLVPAVVVASPTQVVDGVSVRDWHAMPAPANAADLVIEAFACELPDAYLRQMASRSVAPIWINLEYLSAEPWVATHHLLPSPHPLLPLTKYFFFPGFTSRTGGLIRENDLINRRDSRPTALDDTGLTVLLFAYDSAPVEPLFRAMVDSASPFTCHVVEGKLVERLQHWRGSQAESGPNSAPALEFHPMAFVPHADFDSLLWRHDVLFVRGEDSFVRAQWAAKPFIWHVYPQADGAHLTKMDAFLDLYCDGLTAAAQKALRDLWWAWNQPAIDAIGPAWTAFVGQLPVLNDHAGRWSRNMAHMPDLAANLLSFYQKKAKI